ncbi:MAG: hypothetical protein AAGK09_09215 [Planctomycetota bacterium]
MKASFAIVTEQRSGSNMLVDRLDRHPQIACFGEVFRRNVGPDETDAARLSGAMSHLLEIDPVWSRGDSRFAHPGAYIRALNALRPGVPFIGFKLMLGQHLDFAIDCVHDPLRPVVLLRRENNLARWSSNATAKRTGQGAAKAEDRVQRVKVDFDAEDFQRFHERSTAHRRRIDEAMDEAGVRCLRIDYAELSGDPQATLDRIVAHVGAEPGHELPTDFVKRNPSSILDRLNNPQDAMRAIEALGHADWAEEGPQDR